MCISQKTLYGATRKKVITSVKVKVQATDKNAHLLHCTSLFKQVQIVQSFQGREAEIWSNAIKTLLEAIFSLSLNAVSDTLEMRHYNGRLDMSLHISTSSS